MHVHKNDWSLQLDIEQRFPNENYITLSNEKDDFGELGVDLHWNVSDSDKKIIAEASEKLKKKLKENNFDFMEVYDTNSTYNKMEDTYHPVGFIRLGEDEKAPITKDFKVRGFENFYHFSTALFQSAKSINPTAAGFCLIEKHLKDSFQL